MEILDENPETNKPPKPVFSILSLVGFVLFFGIVTFLLSKFPSNIKASETIYEPPEFLKFIARGLLYLLPAFGIFAMVRKEKPDWIKWTSVIIGGVFFLLMIFFFAFFNLV